MSEFKEIERKWLTDESIMDHVLDIDPLFIDQGYLCETTRVRINSRNSIANAVISVKLRESILTRGEFNVPLDMLDAGKILKTLDVMRKQRYTLPNDFVVDMFEDKLSGLFIIEKEFKSEELAKLQTIPKEWKVLEVTDNNLFSNYVLSSESFESVSRYAGMIK